MEEEKKVEEQERDPLMDLTPEQALAIKQRYSKKEDIEAANQRYEELLGKVLEGEQISNPNEAKTEKPDINQLRQELYHSDKPLRNLEVVEKTLALRKAVIEEGNPDPFLPSGHSGDGTKVVIQRSDIEAAERTAEVLENAVKEANGDADYFDGLLKKIIR